MVREAFFDLTRPRHAQRGDAEQEQWLREQLGDEALLAWLGVDSLVEPTGLGRKVKWRYLLTDQRSLMVGWQKEGSPQEHPLPPGELRVSQGSGRVLVRIGSFAWKTLRNNDVLFREVGPLPALPSVERCREVARLNWLTPPKGASLDETAQLVSAWLRVSEAPLDRLTLAYVRSRRASERPEGSLHVGGLLGGGPLYDLVGGNHDGSPELLRWARSWSVDTAWLAEVLEVVLEEPDLVTHGRLLPLHQYLRRKAPLPKKDVAGRVVADLLYARHLMEAGQRRAAVEVLEAQRQRLPDEGLLQVVPDHDLDLTVAGAQGLRIQLLKLLVRARGAPQVPDVEALAELARLQPLVTHVVGDLARVAQGSLFTRAQTWHELLQAPHFQAVTDVSPDDEEGEAIPAVPLPPEELEGSLRHPATRQGGALERLQIWLGRATAPDHGFLRDYAERATSASHPLFMKVLADTALVLGVPAVEAYVSRGKRALGIRAFEGKPPFIVVGARHLSSDQALHWPEGVLRFLIGAELAHLRFRHTRLTSHSMWDGAFEKGSKVFETLGAFAGPLGLLGNAVSGLRRLAFAHALLRKAETVSVGLSRVAEAMGYARRLQGAPRGTAQSNPPRQAAELAESHEALLAACRVMQLTADRAGLLLCGSLPAAVTALFLSSPDYRAELSLAEAHGLVTTLSRRGEQGELLNQGLAIRVAELASFFLSPEYEKLRQAMVGKE
jgi:hypothetical protein